MKETAVLNLDEKAWAAIQIWTGILLWLSKDKSDNPIFA